MLVYQRVDFKSHFSWWTFHLCQSPDRLAGHLDILTDGELCLHQQSCSKKLGTRHAVCPRLGVKSHPQKGISGCFMEVWWGWLVKPLKMWFLHRVSSHQRLIILRWGKRCNLFLWAVLKNLWIYISYVLIDYTRNTCLQVYTRMHMFSCLNSKYLDGQKHSFLLRSPFVDGNTCGISQPYSWAWYGDSMGTRFYPVMNNIIIPHIYTHIIIYNYI